MKSQKGFIVPLLALGLLLASGGALYYYSKDHQATSTTPASTAYTTDAASYASTNQIAGSPIAMVSPSPSAKTPLPSRTALASGVAFAEVSNKGVMPQRLAWQTYTNVDYSYAFSYPAGWQVSGAGGAVNVSDGRANVSFLSTNLALGTDATTFANQSGSLGGFITTKVNAYNALQTTEGGNTVYYIVNGAVGYKISVSNNLTALEAAVVRDILIEFTVTKQR